MAGMFGLFGKAFDVDKDIPDLSGKVILVTGGMSLQWHHLSHITGQSQD